MELRRYSLVDGTDRHAVMTGEKRPPTKGEWYISGAKAYQAENDLSQVHYIARLVKGV